MDAPVAEEPPRPSGCAGTAEQRSISRMQGGVGGSGELRSKVGTHAGQRKTGGGSVGGLGVDRAPDPKRRPGR